MEKLTVGSLFSGIGGIDSGLEMTGGFTVKWQVENNEYSQKVLAKHWPDTPRYGDIRDCGAGRRHELAPVDLLCGGWPCQPHSLAGKRKASLDARDLWGEFYRLIRELKPRYVLGENVMGLLSSENGRFFGRILRDLAASGYDAEWQCISAASVGAPHLRERVILVAYPRSGGCNGREYQPLTGQQECTPDPGKDGNGQPMADPARCGEWQQSHETLPQINRRNARLGISGSRERQFISRSDQDVADATGITEGGLSIRAEETHTWIDECRQDVENATSRREREYIFAGRSQGTQHLSEQSGWWATERGVGRKVDGVSRGLDEDRLTHAWLPGWEGNTSRVTAKQPHRVDRLRGLGNAVVPQVATFVGRCILEHVDFVV